MRSQVPRGLGDARSQNLPTTLGINNSYGPQPYAYGYGYAPPPGYPAADTPEAPLRVPLSWLREYVDF